MKTMIAIALLFACQPAYAPAPSTRLVPVEWKEVNLCLRECELKMRYVTRYEWRLQ